VRRRLKNLHECRSPLRRHGRRSFGVYLDSGRGAPSLQVEAEASRRTAEADPNPAR